MTTPAEKREQLAKEALNAAIWVTCSPHEWVWTHDQQVSMARYVIEASRELDLWRWLTEMLCTVHRDSVIGAPLWVVCDVDGEVIGRGDSPVEAIANAKGPA